MKGIVFTEFLEHVEDAHGAIMAERIISSCELESGGAYTSVGTYPCEEMGELVGALARLTSSQPNTLLHGFGGRLAKTFHAAYPQYFDVANYFDFIESVDSHIHVEVQKLYPDAELPKFVTVSRSENQLVVDYISSRGLEDLAHGLLAASAAVFGETIKIRSEVRGDGADRIVRFTMERS